MQTANWIEERLDCNLPAVFQSLYESVEKDVQTANDKLNRDGRGQEISFTIHKSGDHNLDYQVRRFENMVMSGYVAITRKSREITIQENILGSSSKNTSVKVDWDTQMANCVITLDGEELEIWQIVQRSLETLFFREE